MKKLYTITLALFILGSAANAQTIFSKRNKAETTTPSLRSTKPFETQLPDSAIVFTTSSVDKGDKYLFSRGDDGSIITEKYYDTFGTGYTPSSKTVEKYNAEGRLILEEYHSWDSEKSAWIPQNREVYGYYLGDRINLSEYYSWNETASTWVAEEKEELYFEDANHINGGKTYVGMNNTWLPLEDINVGSSGLKPDGQITFYFSFRHADLPSLPWEPGYNITYKYDEMGNELLVSTEEYDEEAQYGWALGYKEVKEYNASGKIVMNKSFYGNADNTDWVYDGKEIYKYDAAGNLTALEEYNESDIRQSETIYYYPQGSGIETSKADETNVYLANGVLTIDTPQAETISLYSVTGARIYAASKQAGEKNNRR
ncbi:MAG: DUF3836 domain-containing protein [Dysgonomonas sp.]